MGSKLKLACGRTEQALTITKCVNCDQCRCDSYYAHITLSFIIEKTKHLEVKKDKHPPTGIHLSPLFILTAVTDGQNVILVGV